MTQFEFVTGGFSIVLALSVARLLDGLHPAFEARRRYWIYSLWLLIKLFNVPLMYWAGWSFRGTSYGFPYFLLLLCLPAVLYLQANALVPPVPERVESWDAHFWSVRRWFFSLNIAAGVSTGAVSWFGEELASPNLAAAVLVVLLSSIGRFSSSERVHGVLVVLFTANLLLGFGATLVARTG
jgi:hypothetical protein